MEDPDDPAQKITKVEFVSVSQFPEKFAIGEWMRDNKFTSAKANQHCWFNCALRALAVHPLEKGMESWAPVVAAIKKGADVFLEIIDKPYHPDHYKAKTVIGPELRESAGFRRDYDDDPIPWKEVVAKYFKSPAFVARNYGGDLEQHIITLGNPNVVFMNFSFEGNDLAWANSSMPRNEHTSNRGNGFDGINKQESRLIFLFHIGGNHWDMLKFEVEEKYARKKDVYSVAYASVKYAQAHAQWEPKMKTAEADAREVHTEFIEELKAAEKKNAKKKKKPSAAAAASSSAAAAATPSKSPILLESSEDEDEEHPHKATKKPSKKPDTTPPPDFSRTLGQIFAGLSDTRKHDLSNNEGYRVLDYAKHAGNHSVLQEWISVKNHNEVTAKNNPLWINKTLFQGWFMVHYIAFCKDDLASKAMLKWLRREIPVVDFTVETGLTRENVPERTTALGIAEGGGNKEAAAYIREQLAKQTPSAHAAKQTPSAHAALALTKKRPTAELDTQASKKPCPGDRNHPGGQTVREKNDEWRELSDLDEWLAKLMDNENRIRRQIVDRAPGFIPSRNNDNRIPPVPSMMKTSNAYRFAIGNFEDNEHARFDEHEDDKFLVWLEARRFSLDEKRGLVSEKRRKSHKKFVDTQRENAYWRRVDSFFDETPLHTAQWIEWAKSSDCNALEAGLVKWRNSGAGEESDALIAQLRRSWIDKIKALTARIEIDRLVTPEDYEIPMSLPTGASTSAIPPAAAAASSSSAPATSLRLPAPMTRDQILAMRAFNVAERKRMAKALLPQSP